MVQLKYVETIIHIEIANSYSRDGTKIPKLMVQAFYHLTTEKSITANINENKMSYIALLIFV